MNRREVITVGPSRYDLERMSMYDLVKLKETIVRHKDRLDIDLVQMSNKFSQTGEKCDSLVFGNKRLAVKIKKRQIAAIDNQIMLLNVILDKSKSFMEAARNILDAKTFDKIVDASEVLFEEV